MKGLRVCDFLSHSLFEDCGFGEKRGRVGDWLFVEDKNSEYPSCILCRRKSNYVVVGGCLLLCALLHDLFVVGEMLVVGC